jgi:hypothetical protein
MFRLSNEDLHEANNPAATFAHGLGRYHLPSLDLN